jgi:hypothetical protein
MKRKSKVLVKGQAGKKLYKRISDRLQALEDYLFEDFEVFSPLIISGMMDKIHTSIDEVSESRNYPDAFELPEDLSEYLRVVDDGKRLEDGPQGEPFSEWLDMKSYMDNECDNGQGEIDRFQVSSLISIIEITKIKLRYFYETGQLEAPNLGGKEEKP